MHYAAADKNHCGFPRFYAIVDKSSNALVNPSLDPNPLS